MDPDVIKVVELFGKINSIPRCSKDEARIGRWLQQWAASNGFAVKSDAAGNLVVRVPASPGAEAAPTVIIQGHMDMVCEKTPASTHDFSRDAIPLIQDGDWIRADGTTLGADNGIALAYAMALAENDRLMRPPLELLFTVDEETGLNGVKAMAPDLVTGRTLINLDSEDEGVFTIGCAGGRETRVTMKLSMAPLPPSATVYRIVVGGLRGGHSGIDIHKHRGNANQILARTLAGIHQEFPCRLAALKGGTRHNAIARDAEAILALEGVDQGRLETLVAGMEQIFRDELAATDGGMYIKVTPTDSAAARTVAPQVETLRAIRLLTALPHGVAGMSPTFAGLVETSSNLAVVGLSGETVEILCSQRSARVSRLEEITARVHAAAGLSGAVARDENHYPPWPPDMASPLLAQAQQSYQNLHGRPPVIQVIHAGLECAIIGDLYPGMQMISFGPTIESPHSPGERLHLPSVGKVWQFLVALLADLGGGG